MTTIQEDDEIEFMAQPFDIVDSWLGGSTTAQDDKDVDTIEKDPVRFGRGGLGAQHHRAAPTTFTADQNSLRQKIVKRKQEKESEDEDDLTDEDDESCSRVNTFSKTDRTEKKRNSAHSDAYRAAIMEAASRSKKNRKRNQNRKKARSN